MLVKLKNVFIFCAQPSTIGNRRGRIAAREYSAFRRV
jgi:hypothetical protein